MFRSPELVFDVFVLMVLAAMLLIFVAFRGGRETLAIKPLPLAASALAWFFLLASYSLGRFLSAEDLDIGMGWLFVRLVNAAGMTVLIVVYAVAWMRARSFERGDGGGGAA